MEKLTYYDKWLGKYLPHKGTAIGDIYTKLGRLEELEAAGRLVELPEGLDIERVVGIMMNEDVCPGEFGLEEENCRTATCEQCWGAALKGVSNHETNIEPEAAPADNTL